jgi:radical SAM protein with 4Fe4S-binding SPASM domain
MEIQRYEDWSLEVHQQVMAQRTPLSGAIELTRRCNMQCVHCYNNLSTGHPESRRDELTFEEHCRILDEITDAGCLWLLYTGGEIFARSDFLDIYTYAKKKGLLITLFTNGTLITPSIADYLAEWRPFSIEISLYGRTPEIHDRVSGIPGSFERCMAGIRLIRERHLPLILKSMALTINKSELWDLKRFVEEELGLDFRFDAMINPRIDCSLSPLAVRLSPREVVELDLNDRKRMTGWTQFCEHFHGPMPQRNGRYPLFSCGGGQNAFAIDPTGRLSPCVLWCKSTYDLRKGSFRVGWEDFLLKLTQEEITKKTKCLNCQIRAMCGMCPANGLLEGGSPDRPVDFLCQVAHLRAHILNLSIPPHGECEYCKGGGRYEELMQTVKELKSIAFEERPIGLEEHPGEFEERPKGLEEHPERVQDSRKKPDQTR